MPPPSAPLAVGLGALRTSVGDSVHLVSTCQDTVFLALAVALSMLSSSGSVEAKKTAPTLLEGMSLRETCVVEGCSGECYGPGCRPGCPPSMSGSHHFRWAGILADLCTGEPVDGRSVVVLSGCTIQFAAPQSIIFIFKNPSPK